MPILYNEVVDDVSALVNIIKQSKGEYGVVAVTKQDPLTFNNPSKNPTLLIIFVVGESHDTVINTVFPLCYPAKLPRIVVWLKRSNQTIPTYNDALATISCDATINDRTGVYTAKPSDSQKKELETTIKKWIKNPTPFRFVTEIKVAFFENWFRTDESLRNKGVKIGRQICRQLAIEGYASQIKDDKDAIGIVTWDAGSTKLNEAQLLATLAKKGCNFDTFVLVLINPGTFYFPKTGRVLACVKATSVQDQGWTLDKSVMDQVIKVIVSAEEKRINKSKSLAQQGRTLDLIDTKQVIVEEKPIASQISDQDFNDIISETVGGELRNDIDRIRDWLGAVRWKPLPATDGISKYEQYARMQALPDKEIPPLLKALEDMVGTDWRIVELQKTVDRLRERLKQKKDKPQEPDEEFKGTKEQESKTTDELQKLRERITRQEKVISDLQNQKVREKDMMDAKRNIGDLEKSLKSERAASEEMRTRIIAKLKTRVPLPDAKVSLDKAVDQVLETWEKQEAKLQADLKQRMADLAVKENRIAELEAKAQQVVEAKLPDVVTELKRQNEQLVQKEATLQRDLTAKEQRLAELEAKAQQAVEAKVPDDELKRQNEQLLQKEATLQTELKAKEQRLAELEAKEQRLEQENDVLKSRVKDLEKTLKEEEDFDVKAVLTDEQKRWAEDSFLLADLRYALHQNASLDTIKKLANPNLQPRDVSDIIDQIPKVAPDESKKDK